MPAVDAEADREAGTPDAVWLPAPVLGALVEEAGRAAPEEACGLLVGSRAAGGFRITRRVACDNMAPSAMRLRRFEIDPRRVIEEERALRGSAEGVIGFYHSHPEGLPIPSGVDRDYMALWPDAVWVIVGAVGGKPGVRAWRNDEGGPGGVRELEVARHSEKTPESEATG